MNKVTCEQCGGILEEDTSKWGSLKCPYCGATYAQEIVELRVDPDTVKVSARVQVPEFHIRNKAYPKDELVKSIKSELASKLADYLVDYLKISIEQDPAHLLFNIYGELEVKPHKDIYSASTFIDWYR